jgi:hypothetical protein
VSGRAEEVEAGSAGAIGLLVLFTAAAAVLRSIGLNDQLWCDEITTVLNSVRVPLRTLLTSYFYDNQHTLYALLAQGSVAVFGDRPWAVRLPALLFGTAAVPMLYLLGRELTNRFEALAAAGVLALSYHHIWFSQNARGYTALLFAALLATWLLVRGLKEPGWRAWLLYAVTVALGMYTHLTMVFVAVSHAVLCGWLLVRPASSKRWQTEWRRTLAAFGLAAALTLLLYAPMLADVFHFFLHKPTGMKVVSTPRWAIGEVWNVLQQGLGGQALIAASVFLGGLLVIGLGLWSYGRQDPVILLLFVLPGVVTVGGALAARGTMYPRFFFGLLGFGLLIVTRGLVVLGDELTNLAAKVRPVRFPRLAGSMLVALAMVCAAAPLAANYRRPKQDFEGAIAFVTAERTEGEPVVIAGLAGTLCCQRYYEMPWKELRSPDQLTELRGAGRRVWLVYAFPRYLEPENAELAAAISRQFTVQREFHGTVSGGAVVVACAPPSTGKPTP